MNAQHPFAIATPSKTQGFDIGENQRNVTVTPAGPTCFQVNINNKPVGRPCNREAAVQLARTLDPQFTLDREEETRLPIHTLTGGKPLSANSVVRQHQRIGPDGRQVMVRRFYREQPRPAAGATRGHNIQDLEQAMTHHDTERFRTTDPNTFNAHSASLTALSATERATEQGGEAWHELAATAHGEAAEFWAIVGDKEHATRHQRAADFHARQCRSAGGHAANAVEIANAELWVA
ncbi:MAG: hypothetical protein KIS67_12950 [Verrucomicrobiae bacterium]|nr:hypothetical protein [Verrucomicrobiae bacterium]